MTIACQIMTASQAELKGKNMAIVLPPPFAEQHAQTIKSFVASGTWPVDAAGADCGVDCRLLCISTFMLGIGSTGERPL